MATKRGYYREELERSVDNIEMSLTHLARVIEAYEQDHKDISDIIRQAGNALVEVANVIQRVHDQI